MASVLHCAVCAPTTRHCVRFVTTIYVDKLDESIRLQRTTRELARLHDSSLSSQLCNVLAQAPRYLSGTHRLVLPEQHLRSRECPTHLTSDEREEQQRWAECALEAAPHDVASLPPPSRCTAAGPTWLLSISVALHPVFGVPCVYFTAGSEGACSRYPFSRWLLRGEDS